MKWRNQNKNPNRNNQTLDSFLTGIDSSRNTQSVRKTNVIRKIRIPPSSGLQPLTKPLNLPFMYPQYPEFRQYQYSIALKCVVQNSLVCLPTGLGKTHIASVIMLNFHRWFPQGLIFFLAPTKPLVDQQSMSLSNFSQFVPLSCIFTLTGSVQAPKRIKAYEKKRIFFSTPQTLENDLVKERLDPKRIVLLIIDQAHKATGNYSYANIVRFLDKHGFGFRLIGLSATPGNDKDRIQEVIENLQISNMIVKTDDDEDVKKYIKRKIVEPVYISNTAIIREVEQILQQFISWPLNQLLKLRLFDRHLAGGKHGFNSKCFFLINNQINQRLPQLPYKMIYMVQCTKCFLKFLADSLTLLREAGYESFKRKFIYEIDEIETEDQNDRGFVEKSKIHQNFLKLIREHPKYKRIKQLFQCTTKVLSHPKLEKLREILSQFLTNKENLERKSKVIIFANLRYTCHQIHKYLSQPPCCDIIKSEIFLGQSKTTVETREGEISTTQTLKLSQKDQVSLIKKFKANQINTLISTSIGEQGLDIGEVDAIFCYDGGMSTIRMVQRMGRTGRKRDGSVFVLLMEGKEAAEFDKANKKTQRIKKTNAQKYKYYSFNPALFDELSQIPIIFFSEPPQQTILQIKSQVQRNEQSSETKRKITIKNKADEKKTKKKQASQQILVKQASKSQEQDECSGQKINQVERKKAREKQLFKIKGEECTMIENSIGDQLMEQDEQCLSIKGFDEITELDAHINSGDEQSGSQYSLNENSFSLGVSSDDQTYSRRVYDKFDNLFSEQLIESQNEPPSCINRKNHQIYEESIPQSQPESQSMLSKKSCKDKQLEQAYEHSQLDELFEEYHKAKRKNNPQQNLKENEKILPQSKSEVENENESENSSQIINQQEKKDSSSQESDQFG